jgi:hypothetical protein
MLPGRQAEPCEARDSAPETDPLRPVVEPAEINVTYAAAIAEEKLVAENSQEQRRYAEKKYPCAVHGYFALGVTPSRWHSSW